MSRIQRDQVVQTLATNGADYSFAVRIRHWTSNGRFHYFQTEASEILIDLGRENSIAIMDQLTIIVAVEERSELLPCPLRRGMVRHVHMQHAACSDLDRDKYRRAPGRLP